MGFPGELAAGLAAGEDHQLTDPVAGNKIALRPTMTILPIVLISACALVAAYFFYGRLVMRWLGTDPARKTPAVEMQDGNDYVPAPAGVVLGGHFTAIAAAGPVVGPILAGLMFGWLPALLWIVLGAIFIGGVHDSGALFASIRHKARSITQVVREHMSPVAYLTFLMFVWLSLVYVIIAFADVTAGTFSKFVSFTETRGQLERTFSINGGSVVIGACGYLVASVTLGLFLRFTRVPWWALLIVHFFGLAATIYFAPAMARWLADAGLSFLDTQGKDAALLARRWDLVLLLYCCIASIVPLWLLLQPRGVIGATFLYAALAFGVVGTLVGGWNTSGPLVVQYPAFLGFTASNGALLFPFLFITIACGACSGFHSIVASGTTCKQLRSEADLRPVAYGAMLLEAMVAVFALSCVMVLSRDARTGSPDFVYAQGIANFMNLLGIDKQFALGFGLLAFSSFVFDTLDVCTRLGRYVFQELTGLRGLSGGILATLATVAGPAAYLWFAPPEWGFRTFWTIFGTSNQLLAALTLVGVSVWLWRTGRPVWFALLPAVFMLASTGTALVMNFQAFLSQYRLAVDQLRSGAPMLVNMAVALVLLGLGLLVVAEALRVWVRSRSPVPVRS
ncbi:MAG: carbon starvation protein A [Phycisphaerae bacterium]|nr:carbon starvation protein A [Phycisphaerae bacterium]MDW8263028.1 carbon starvation CstA family protein [Phycisphaerales bacterium]